MSENDDTISRLERKRKSSYQNAKTCSDKCADCEKWREIIRHLEKYSKSLRDERDNIVNQLEVTVETIEGQEETIADLKVRLEAKHAALNEISEHLDDLTLQLNNMKNWKNQTLDNIHEFRRYIDEIEKSHTIETSLWKRICVLLGVVLFFSNAHLLPSSILVIVPLMVSVLLAGTFLYKINPER